MNDSLAVELDRYLTRFPYRIVIKAGATYTPQFKEFNTWCNENLGIKYKDWFLSPYNRTAYRLYLRDTKYSMFLALKFSDLIDTS